MSANVKIVVGSIIASVGIAAGLTTSGVVAKAPVENSSEMTTVQVWVTDPDGSSEPKEEYFLEEGNKNSSTEDYYDAGPGVYTVQTHLFSSTVDEWSDPVQVTIK